MSELDFSVATINDNKQHIEEYVDDKKDIVYEWNCMNCNWEFSFLYENVNPKTFDLRSTHSVQTECDCLDQDHSNWKIRVK